MKPLIPVLISLFTLFNLSAQAQRSDAASGLRTADEIRHEQHRLALERNKIVVRYEKDPRGEYFFYCDNKTFSTYTVTVSFPEFTNLQADIPLPAIVEGHP